MSWDANTLVILATFLVLVFSKGGSKQRSPRGKLRCPRRGWACGLLAGAALAVACCVSDVSAQEAPDAPVAGQPQAASPVDQPGDQSGDQPGDQSGDQSGDQPGDQSGGQPGDEAEAAEMPGESGLSADGPPADGQAEVADEPEAADETAADAEPVEPAPTDADPLAPPAGQAAPAKAASGSGGWRQNGWIMLAVFLGVLILPFVFGKYFTSSWRLPEYRGKLSFVLVTLFAGLAIAVMGWPPETGIDLRGGVILVYEVKEDADQEQRDLEAQDQSEADSGLQTGVDMDKLIAAVSRRINPGGVKEVIIRKYGAGQIEIIIPEVDETEVERIKDLITRIGTLEFRILANNRDHALLQEDAKKSDADRLYVLDEDGNPVLDAKGKRTLRGWWVPVGINEKTEEEYEFDYPEILKRKREVGGRERTEILVVKDAFDVNGGYLVRSTSSVDQTTGQPCVNFRFNARGGRLFRGLTGDNKPDEVQEFWRKLGIVLDGYLFSAPRINDTIGERGTITGEFDQKEVDILVSVLNAGSLPATLNKDPSSQLATGPTLGSDTIRRGKNAMLLSMGLVLVFMIFYYRFAGIVACLALLANLVLILAVMISVNAAFTLPGLAGLVLTVGMAVDANVLIFERIREELDRKAALRMAIRNGFARATTTIVDANLTTLITATVLYAIGSDQVKGFAFVLWLGVVLSMYTAIFCSRLVFDIAEKKRWLTELRMRRMIGGTKIDFLGKRRMAAIGSLVVILVGLIAVFGRGKGLLDIDFTGGVSVQTMFDEAQDISDVRRQLGGKLQDLTVSDVQIPGEPKNRRFMINTSIPPGEEGQTNQAQKYLDEVKQTIREEYGSKLAHYSMTWTPPKTDAPSGAAPAEPSAESETRNDLPSSTMLASADPAAILLAQADPPEETAAAAAPAAPPVQGPSLPGLEASKAKPEAKPSPEEPAGGPAGAEPSATPIESPSPGEAETVERSEAPRARWTLNFEKTHKVSDTESYKISYKVSYNALVERFEAQMGPGRAVEQPVEFELTNRADHEEEDEKGKKRASYEEDGDPERGHSTWEIGIELSGVDAEALFKAVKAELESEPYFPSSNTIGGKVAGNTQVKAILALLASLLGIVAYIWFRFQRVMFAVAAVVALVHDVLITLGVIALSAYVANFLGFLLIEEFKIGLSVLAAFLTIIGYSLNDTIVVFDRIREVRGKSPELTVDMVNLSINQTLSRTLLTSMTTLMVVVILYFLGGQGIHSFAFSLVVGVLVGTYSSIFVASPTLLWMARR